MSSAIGRLGLADGLTLARFAAAGVLPSAVVAAAHRPTGSPLPLVLCCFAAATDFADGRLARQRGPTRYGALLDGLADLAFVLAATGSGAAMGLLPAAVPVAIAAAFAAYARGFRRSGRAARPPRTMVGHAAGVANYLLAGLLAAALAWPGPGWRRALAVGAVAVIALNGTALALRAVPRGSAT